MVVFKFVARLHQHPEGELRHGGHHRIAKHAQAALGLLVVLVCEPLVSGRTAGQVPGLLNPDTYALYVEGALELQLAVIKMLCRLFRILSLHILAADSCQLPPMILAKLLTARCDL